MGLAARERGVSGVCVGGCAGFWGMEGTMGGQWEEEKAWGAPNVVEEKRGVSPAGKLLPSLCCAPSSHLGHPPSLAMLPFSLAAPVWPSRSRPLGPF